MESELSETIAGILPADYEPLRTFWEHDMSDQGALILAGVALRASKNGILAEDVRAIFDEFWKTRWSYQHPDIRAAIRGPEIKHNLETLRQIFLGLKMPMPEYISKAKIPRGPIVVTTLYSLYRLGSARDRLGLKRSISRDGKPLGFSSGHIIHLELGDSMLFGYREGRKNSVLSTSAVLFID